MTKLSKEQREKLENLILSYKDEVLGFHQRKSSLLEVEKFFHAIIPYIEELLSNKDLEAEQKIAEAVNAEKERCQLIIQTFTPDWWLHDQGYEGDEAFTTSDLQDVMEDYQEYLVKQIQIEPPKD